VGRRHDLAEVERLLKVARLVTLTGAGGVGKSRLAVRVASRRQRAFRHGTWLVELAGVRDPRLVAHAVAEALPIGEQTGRALPAILADFLRDRHLLLILDNCEHVSDACATLAASMLRAAADLRIVATSREPLGILGEHLWPVAPLEMPGPDHVLPTRTGDGYPALLLFLDRATAVEPRFALTPDNQGEVVRICRRLDGIPLAIELAAVRMRSMSVAQLSARLDDRFALLARGNRAPRPGHHETLDAAIRWSYELCSPPAQLLWARLSVFAGSLDAAAAQTVCPGGELSAGDMRVGLDDLVDKSVLLREEYAGHVRYRLLETLREYGNHRLREVGGEAALRRAHRDFYLGLAEQLSADWFGPDQLEWHARLRAEHDNLRGAMEYCLCEPGQTRAGMRLATGLWFYWASGAHLREGRYWMDRFLAADPRPSPERIVLLAEAGRIALAQGDLAAAETMLVEARALARQHGDDAGYARATQHLSWAVGMQGKHAMQRTYSEEALAWYADQFPPDPLHHFARLRQATFEAFSGDAHRGLELCDQCRVVSEQHGELWVQSYAHNGIAYAMWRLGRLDEARRHAHEGLRIKRQFADALGIAVAIELLAWIAARKGQARRGATLLGTAAEVWRSFGVRTLGPQLESESHAACEIQLRQELGTAGFEAAVTAGAGRTLDQAVADALGEPRTEPARASVARTPPTSGAGADWSLLTRREQEVAKLICAGLSNKQIAARLVIATRTAEGHVEHILAKLGLTNRAQLAVLVAADQSPDVPHNNHRSR
jgi:predicted ATPase/DNA-binding CsgD family transcriptional regulator